MTGCLADPADADPADAGPAGSRSGTDALRLDATEKAALYARLSRRAAAGGDAAVATAAAWASDVFTVQALLWERAPDAGAAGYQRFLAVGAAIGHALDAAATSGVPRDARELVVAARRALLAAFDPPAAALISGQLVDLEHLAELPVPGAVGVRPGRLSAQVGDRPAPVAAADLDRTAGDCRVVAAALAAAGFGRDAACQAYLGEVAAFEGYLLHGSSATGDGRLLAAELRRAALAEVLPAPADLPADPRAVRSAVREALGVALTPAELDRFAGPGSTPAVALPRPAGGVVP